MTRVSSALKSKLEVDTEKVNVDHSYSNHYGGEGRSIATQEFCRLRECFGRIKKNENICELKEKGPWGVRIAGKSERAGVLEKMDSGIQEERKANFFAKESDIFPLIKEERFFVFFFFSEKLR